MPKIWNFFRRSKTRDKYEVKKVHVKPSVPLKEPSSLKRDIQDEIEFLYKLIDEQSVGKPKELIDKLKEQAREQVIKSKSTRYPVMKRPLEEAKIEKTKLVSHSQLSEMEERERRMRQSEMSKVLSPVSGLSSRERMALGRSAIKSFTF